MVFLKKLIKKRPPVWVRICLGLVFTYYVFSGFSLNEERLFARRHNKGIHEDFGGVSLQNGLWTKDGTKELGVKRKDIYDRNMKTLAVSLKTVSVYLRPLELRERGKAIRSLSKVLELNESELHSKLRSERSFVWLKRNIGLAKAQELASYDFSGVYLVDEWQRLYPYRQHGAHAIGFVKEEHGLSGVEFVYDNILRGELGKGSANLQRAGLRVTKIPEKGANLVLSLDIDLQIILEKELAKLLSKTKAQSTSAILMDVKSGEIYAMANLPSYDPNLFWNYKNYERQNRGLVNPVKLGGLTSYLRAVAELGSGHDSRPSPLYVDESAHRVIKAAQRKKVFSQESVHANSIWGEFDQFHISPDLKWPTDHSVEKKRLVGVCQDLQLAKASNIDLPEEVNHQLEMDCNLSDVHSSSSSVNILKSFAWLLNGGGKVTPHILKAVSVKKNQQRLFTEFNSAVSTEMSPNNNDLFVKFLKEQMPQSYNGAIVLESLESVVGSAKDTKSIAGEVKSYNMLTLGFSSPDSQLALVVVSREAEMNLRKSSPLRNMVFSIFKQGEKIMASSKNEEEGPVAHSQQELYAMWNKIHQSLKPNNSSNDKTAKKIMPEVKGLSLRKAMQALQGYNMQFRIVGAGQVARQFPEPGGILDNGVSCILELKMVN